MSKYKKDSLPPISKRELLLDSILGPDEEMDDELADKILGSRGVTGPELVEGFRLVLQSELRQHYRETNEASQSLSAALLSINSQFQPESESDRKKSRIDGAEPPNKQSKTIGLAAQSESDIVTALELAFSTKSLRQLCESEAIAKRKLGACMAEKLKRRLADLRAATSIKDLVAGRPRELESSRYKQIAVELGEGTRIVFCANHKVVPVLQSGGVDWSRVSRVKILEIETP